MRQNSEEAKHDVGAAVARDVTVEFGRIGANGKEVIRTPEPGGRELESFQGSGADVVAGRHGNPIAKGEEVSAAAATEVNDVPRRRQRGQDEPQYSGVRPRVAAVVVAARIVALIGRGRGARTESFHHCGEMPPLPMYCWTTNRHSVLRMRAINSRSMAARSSGRRGEIPQPYGSSRKVVD